MRPRLPRGACAVAVTVTVATMVGATASAAATGPDDTSDSTAATDPPAFDLESPFWSEATAMCTGVLNSHLEPRGDTFSVVAEILEADAGDEAPSVATIASWTEALAADVARSEAIRAELAAFDVTDPAHADLWDLVVTSADEGVEVQRTRLAALETGDWSQIVDVVGSTLGRAGGTSDGFYDAIDATPLRGSDCAVVHIWRMPDDEAVTAEFVTAVTEACVTVADRRRTSSFAGDSAVSLAFLAATLGDDADDIEIPDDLEPALARIVEEWQATVGDFATIDPALAPSPEDWAEITAVPNDRLRVFQARHDAAAAGDTAALVEAYDRANFGDHPGWDWPRVGLEGRNCTGLAS